MFFVNGKKDGENNDFIVTTASSARRTGSPTVSGNNTNDLVQNIYDLENNYYELTAMVNSTYGRVDRGSPYSKSNSASNRSIGSYPTGTYNDDSSRATLYM